MELNKIFCGDCLKLMKDIPDKSIDLILTDPPYGIQRDKLNMGKGGGVAKHIDYGKYEWDRNIPAEEYFKEMFRVSKNQIIFGGNYMTKYLPPSSCWLVWDKDNGDSDFADCELAWTSFDSAVRKFKWKWAGMLQEKMCWKEKRFHPTQKPVPLFRWILDKYSKKGDIVLDPFLGSGTTAVACIQMNRQWIGVEINPDYCKIAQERIAKMPVRLDNLKLGGNANDGKTIQDYGTMP